MNTNTIAENEKEVINSFLLRLEARFDPLSTKGGSLFIYRHLVAKIDDNNIITLNHKLRGEINHWAGDVKERLLLPTLSHYNDSYKEFNKD